MIDYHGQAALFRAKDYTLINNDLDMHIQAKTNDRKVRSFGDILAPLSRETKLKMRLRESSVINLHKLNKDLGAN